MECPYDESIPEGGRKMKTALIYVNSCFRVEVEDDVPLEDGCVIVSSAIDIIKRDDLWEDVDILDVEYHDITIKEEK
jgi:hypothetical protein